MNEIKFRMPVLLPLICLFTLVFSTLGFADTYNFHFGKKKEGGKKTVQTPSENEMDQKSAQEEEEEPHVEKQQISREDHGDYEAQRQDFLTRKTTVGMSPFHSHIDPYPFYYAADGLYLMGAWLTQWP